MLNLLGVLGDLLLQDVDFVGIFGVQFFQDRLVTEVASAFLHGFGDDTGDFVAGHGAAAFKGTVAHAFDDAFFGQIVQGFIGPVVFGDIGEAVSRCGQGRAGSAESHGSQDNQGFFIQIHGKDLFSYKLSSSMAPTLS